MNGEATVTSDERLLTVTQAAALMQMNPKTLTIWRSAGKGPKYLKCGRAVRYRMADLRAWQESVVVDPTKGDRA